MGKDGKKAVALLIAGGLLLFAPEVLEALVAAVALL